MAYRQLLARDGRTLRVRLRQKNRQFKTIEDLEEPHPSVSMSSPKHPPV